MICYLHGLNSGPASWKASSLREYMSDLGIACRLIVPQLPSRPQEAVRLVEALLAEHDVRGLVGSSLGGFYALQLAERYGLPAVLINPALDPLGLLPQYMGCQHNSQLGEDWVLDACVLEELASLYVTPTQPERYMVIVGDQDEVVDFRDTLARLPHSPRRIIQSGNHTLAEVVRYWPEVVSFCLEK